MSSGEILKVLSFLNSPWMSFFPLQPREARKGQTKTVMKVSVPQKYFSPAVVARHREMSDIYATCVEKVPDPSEMTHRPPTKTRDYQTEKNNRASNRKPLKREFISQNWENGRRFHFGHTLNVLCSASRASVSSLVAPTLPLCELR